MRRIDAIICHCSATSVGNRYRFEDCRRDHIVNNHWADIGYHYYIEKDGKVHRGRSLEVAGAHCKGHNANSIGICYEGGLDINGKPKDTRTEDQKFMMRALIVQLKKYFPDARVYGHNHFNHNKDCPCFDTAEYDGL